MIKSQPFAKPQPEKRCTRPSKPPSNKSLKPSFDQRLKPPSSRSLRRPSDQRLKPPSTTLINSTVVNLARLTYDRLLLARAMASRAMVSRAMVSRAMVSRATIASLMLEPDQHTSALNPTSRLGAINAILVITPIAMEVSSRNMVNAPATATSATVLVPALVAMAAVQPIPTPANNVSANPQSVHTGLATGDSICALDTSF